MDDAKIRVTLSLSCGGITNPYGERNLEEAKDMPFRLQKQLEKETKEALRKKQRPAKPADLPALIRQAKEEDKKRGHKPWTGTKGSSATQPAKRILGP